VRGAIAVPLVLTVLLGSSTRVGAQQLRIQTSQRVPTVRFATIAGFPLAVAGQKWTPVARTTVTARSGGAAQEIVLRTTDTGTFLIAVSGFNRCNGLYITVHDALGHQAALHLPNLKCASSLPARVPNLVVLKGTTVTESPQPQGAAPVPGWHRYHNIRAGYRIDYPASWTVKEHPGTAGIFNTVFTSSPGGAEIDVTVRPRLPDDVDTGNFASGGCHRVLIGELAGMQCLDTASSRTVTTVQGHGTVYRISTSDNQAARIYDYAVSSFRLE
jgi:hypothetical protein